MSNLNLTQEKLAAIRSEYKYRNIRGKYPRQKMLPEYQSIYPWVLPDETDPYFTFCTVCECRLSAKRSDLGKHEGSIKHTENALKKGLSPHINTTENIDGGLVLKEIHIQQQKQQIKLESTLETAPSCDEDRKNEELDGDSFYIKQEPVVQLLEASDSIHNLEMQSQYALQDSTLKALEDNVHGEDVDDDDDDEEEDIDDDYDVSAQMPPAKQRICEVNYMTQPSTKAECIPMRMSESATQRFSIPEVGTVAVALPAIHKIPATTIQSSSSSNAHMVAAAQYKHKINSLATPQAPCKITIKKVTAPIITPPAHIHASAATTAKIKPVSTSISISKQQQQPPSSHQLMTTPTTQSTTTLEGIVSSHSRYAIATASLPTTSTAVPTIVRDSFDLFFDSICASVKALPPRLATEGKIRVMQLIGELELRAISEHEQSQVVFSGQQNSTVASTTK